MSHFSDPVRRDLTRSEVPQAPPAVDVVVPAFRRPQALARCLKALAAQTVGPASVEVVDDSATARGPAWARNQGWRRGSAPVVAFTEDGCLPHPDWVKRIQAAFADTRVDALEGSVLARSAAGAPVPIDPPPWVRWDRFHGANVAYRRVLLENMGGFNERYRHRDDTDLAWRVLARGVRIHPAPEAKVLREGEPEATPRFDAASEVRLYRLDPQRYAECVAHRMHFEAVHPGALKALRDALYSKELPADLKPLSAMEDLKLRAAAAAQVVRWRVDGHPAPQKAGA